MTKLEGCKAVLDPDDFRTIQEQLPSRFIHCFQTTVLLTYIHPQRSKFVLLTVI